ncbi:cytochrome P450 [Salix suchowensis]|nr:cytochrome P450 [Salix suchowensis]
MFQEREATLLIDQLRKQPALFEEHLDRAGASLALSTIYGLPTVTDSHDARIVRVDEFTQRFLKAAMPGTISLNTLLGWHTCRDGCSAKAQEEIDRVVGRDRTPTFKDFDALMYIRAIVKETLRWRPVGPIDSRGLNLDSTVYGPDVESFNPERFLDSDGNLKHSTGEIKEEGHVTYGFGQRTRRFRSRRSDRQRAWSVGVISRSQDAVPDSSIDYRRPEPFLCDFEPRAPEVLDIIAETKDRYELPG